MNFVRLSAASLSRAGVQLLDRWGVQFLCKQCECRWSPSLRTQGRLPWRWMSEGVRRSVLKPLEGYPANQTAIAGATATLPTRSECDAIVPRLNDDAKLLMTTLLNSEQQTARVFAGKAGAGGRNRTVTGR